MRILFDQGTPLPLREWLAAHRVETARQHGWSELLNGNLLAAAEAAGFDLFVTTDQDLRHQLDLSRFRIAVLVLKVANWPMIEPAAATITALVDRIDHGEYAEWSPPS
jgi:predicted nuclease of predicted toxin-antitoxin system